MKPSIQPRVPLLIALSLSLLLMAGCALMLRDQPRYEPFEESTFFDDGASVRQPVPDTVARGQPVADTLLTTGRIDRQFADSFPFTVTLATLERGRERYDIFCSPCHGLVGDGNGLMTEYGMPAPDSFHDPDVRDEPAGYYFALITGGTRVMPSYAARIPPEDRWAIVAYIRALQLSQNADVSELPADLLPALQETDTVTH
jgi:mono/diheme cytochrome c family protein